MRRFLVLKNNFNPYYSGYYDIVRAKNLDTFSKKLKKYYDYENIFAIYDVTNSIELSSFFLK